MLIAMLGICSKEELDEEEEIEEELPTTPGEEMEPELTGELACGGRCSSCAGS